MPELDPSGETQAREQAPGGARRLPPDSDPWAIVNDPALDDPTKLARLQQLEYDVRQVEVASDEGMAGRTALPGLHEVLAAIAELGAPGRAEPTPTKV